jgi:hypothetical protein
MMLMQKLWVIAIEDKLWTISNFKPWARWTYDELECEFMRTQKKWPTWKKVLKKKKHFYNVKTKDLKWILCNGCTIMKGRNIFNCMWKFSLQVPFQQPRVQHHERADFHVPLCCQSTKAFSNVLQGHAWSSNNKSNHIIFLFVERWWFSIVR